MMPAPMQSTSTMLDVQKIREDFPGLHQQVRGKNLVWLDNGATAQKPRVVIEAMDQYYRHFASNVHRAVHALSDVATRTYEESRRTARRFLNAAKEHEVVFTKGTTDGINLVARSWGGRFLQSGDEIILSGMEHHSNIVPWQLIAEEKGAIIRVIPVTDSGELDLAAFNTLLNERTRIVAVTHISNALGTVNPVAQIIAQAHAAGAVVLLDGAQAAPHLPIDVQALDVDFYVCSAHKVFGPTGAGLLYGRESLLESMPPYQGGGDMIKTVSFEKTTFNDLPFKFEAGTPNISGVIGMGAALDYVMNLPADALAAHEQALLAVAHEKLGTVDDLQIVGRAESKVPVLSLHIKGVHPSDLGTLLDMEGIAVRAGHHCTQPLMQRFNLTGTCRASFAFYNSLEEVDLLVAGIQKALKMLR